MRKKMLNILRSTGPPERRVWSIDGKVCAREPAASGLGERKIVVNTYSDFLKLKWDDYKCEYIGLYAMQ